MLLLFAWMALIGAQLDPVEVAFFNDFKGATSGAGVWDSLSIYDGICLDDKWTRQYVVCNALKTNIVELIFENERMSGTLPSSIQQLTLLSIIRLSENMITSVPPTLAALPLLTYLDLGTNSMSGTIPTQLGQLSNLQVLYLDSNGFEGNIPSQFVSLTSLTALGVDNNLLSGKIPEFLSSLPLVYLDISVNHFSGTIPDTLLSTIYAGCPPAMQSCYDYHTSSHKHRDCGLSGVWFDCTTSKDGVCIRKCSTMADSCNLGGLCTNSLAIPAAPEPVIIPLSASPVPVPVVKTAVPSPALEPHPTPRLGVAPLTGANCYDSLYGNGVCVDKSSKVIYASSAMKFLSVTESNITINGDLFNISSIKSSNSTIEVDGSININNGNMNLFDSIMFIKGDLQLNGANINMTLNSTIHISGKSQLKNITLQIPYTSQGEYILIDSQTYDLTTSTISLNTPSTDCPPKLKITQKTVVVILDSKTCTENSTTEPIPLVLIVSVVGGAVGVILIVSVAFCVRHSFKERQKVREFRKIMLKKQTSNDPLQVHTPM